MLAETSEPARSTSLWPGVFALLVSFGLVAATLLALVLPWIWEPAPGGPQLARYAPLRDGNALLYAVDDTPPPQEILAAWQPRAWESSNTRLLPVGQALVNVLDKDLRDALVDFYHGSPTNGFDIEALVALTRGSAVYQQRSQLVDAKGEMTTTVTLLVRNAAGDHLIGLQDETNGLNLRFTPAPLYLPAGLAVGRTWQAAGTLGEASYQITGTVVQAGAYTSVLGRYADCLRVEQRLVLARDEVTLHDQLDRSWLCDGIGTVATESVDGTEAPVRRSLLVAAAHLPDPIRRQVSAHAGLLPPTTAVDTQAANTAVQPDWTLARVGRTLPGGQTGENTIPPVWVPGDALGAPPLVLGAGYLGDLVAFDASAVDGQIRWRYHPGGTVYGPPGYDPTTGILYFGASDKRLYALNRQGLFLWSRAVGDNIATVPLVAADTVVVGSEDRTIYGVDAHTGALRWQVSTGGPVVSSPAQAAGVVAIGSDDGAVYGLDPATGTQRWLYDTGDPVEAPIAADADTFYVASRGNLLVALAAQNGSERWSVQTRYALRTAPVVDATSVYVVDGWGDLAAYERSSGRRRWTLPNRGFAGPPAIIGDALFVTDGQGAVHQLDLAGRESTSWRPDGNDVVSGYAFGPVAGGGALWLADGAATIRRLGPPLLTTPLPALAWTRTWLDPPFAEQPFVTTPVVQGGAFYLLDQGNVLYRLDPAGDRVERITRIGDGAITLTEPVVADDLFLAPVSNKLIAVALPEGNVRWQFEGEGIGISPPAVSGEHLLWLTQDDESQQSFLYALDLDTGRLQWQAARPAVPLLGGVVADASTAYVSTPPIAFDLATGNPRWQLDSGRVGVGRPLLSTDGRTLFVGMLHEDQNSGVLLALDPADGSVRWEHTLPAPPGPLDQMWQHGDHLIVPLYATTGDLIALAVHDGTEQWRYHPPVSRIGTVSLIGDRLWLPLQDGRIVLLDAGSGDPLATLGDPGANRNSSSYAQRPVALGESVLVPLADQLSVYREPPRP